MRHKEATFQQSTYGAASDLKDKAWLLYVFRTHQSMGLIEGVCLFSNLKYHADKEGNIVKRNY